ncbi:MAG: hypothetical protein AAB839_02350, partial [Patescibacteria group bacterium]
LQTITFENLTNTTTGSLTFTSNRWTVGTTGPQTLPDGSTRVIKIEDISRDSQCFIITSGGTVDTDSKKITSETTWIDSAGRSHTQTLASLRTRWENPQGSCFAPTQVSQVSFNVSGAQFSGGKQLRQVYFTNNGSTNVTIDTVSFTWTNSAELSQLFMDTSKVWSETGPGTPTDEVDSGETIDIQNFVLAAGATAELNKGQFDDPMSGTTLTMTVTFTDGSTWTSPPFNPT